MEASMIRLTVLVCFILSVAVRGSAQTASVSGTVVDQTGAATPGATVQLTGPTNYLTTSGSGGQYTFRNVTPGTYTIEVRLAGFSPAIRANVMVSSANLEVPAIALALASLNDLVVVTATRGEAALVDVPATMSVLTADTIASSSAQNYGDLLRSVPGLNVIQTSARDINLTSRQATTTLSNSQLVLVDGRSIYLDFFGIVLWDFLPTNLPDIKQIEVIRGPASAVWGANAETGVVNIITKSPREAPGTTASVSGGVFGRDAGSSAGKGPGGIFGSNASFARVVNDRWSYRLSAGYFASDAFPRPTGTIPLITDPRDPSAKVGGAAYPDDRDGPLGTAFKNTGTSQPKFEARIDQELEGGRVSYGGGIAGSNGIIHTGIGPFNIQKGSNSGYGKVNYNRGALKVHFFTNYIDAEAPNLLLASPTGTPLQLNFSTQTYDFEAGDAFALGRHQVLSVGGNVRRNNFNITLDPNAENRTELGAYVQDEIFADRFRFTLGGRVDKFGNLSDPVFSPRLAMTFKPTTDQGVRVSFNRAFRSPSVTNNYLDITIVVPTNLSGLAPLLPAPLKPLVAAPFPLAVRAVGSRLPVGTIPQNELVEESLTAYEIAYDSTVRRTRFGAAFFVNDTDDQINFSQLPPNLDPYTAANPPPGWLLPPSILTAIAANKIFLPRTGFTYLNLGPIRQTGFELSVDHQINSNIGAFANYSWQSKPTVLDAPNPYPFQELALPPTNRFNAGFSFEDARFLGSASVNYSDKAFWSDVLTSPYHGFTDAYTMVNGGFGVKWAGGKITTLVRGANLFNQEIQQHIFGDIIKASVVGEVRFKLP
jgi:outer membrane receptor protein involved in Fe transport